VKSSKPSVVHSTTLKHRVAHHLSLLCGVLGCDAIEARVLWRDGRLLTLVEADAGAADGDVAKLRRIPRNTAMAEQ